MRGRLLSVTPKQVLRALERARFFVHHVRGSHYCLAHPDQPEVRITVPFHGKDVKRGVPSSILKQAGLTPHEHPQASHRSFR